MRALWFALVVLPFSVLAALSIEADQAGRVLVDATSLFMRDAANVILNLPESEGGPERWRGVALLLQVTAGVVAFRLERESLRGLVLLPLQQIVYRQLMYAVLIQSVASAFAGTRLRCVGVVSFRDGRPSMFNPRYEIIAKQVSR